MNQRQALLLKNRAADGTELEVEINGEMYSARVVGAPLYDPSGERMRG